MWITRSEGDNMIARYELTITIDVQMDEDNDPREYISRAQKRFIERSFNDLIKRERYWNYDVELTNAELVSEDV